ncbi:MULTISPECIES: glycoside hydrolase family 9 protein [unclassified Streptomyces]|uniref:glycoside hydrolase family 9 protein n=1 Tax=unclassified Streptomyces TaxID=2593676 RepID=UPI00081E6350|nr:MULTISPECIES: glycoside hydrolase family 9 protein [unclassified Streptomyces]MYZ38771.1 endoglucanase [Streptomyces sp. SID4917]SCG00287.1 endoglucanase [Streptomyces sp. MnatMP-M17]
MPLLTHPSPSALRRGLVGVLSGVLAVAGLTAAPRATADAAAPKAAAAIAVQVNQVGYLPDGPKRATVVTAATAPTAWELRSAAGATVASGVTTARGADTASGDSTHLADFSSYTGTGTGYTLVVDGQRSHPFDIRAGLYNTLRSDAMSFFYQQRSGIAIDPALAGAAYARPAGHLGIAPNKGDTSVPCQAGVCDYSRDVRGGWYDAGDHGKYVVNGGLSTWLLVNSFERAKRAGTDAALGDSTLRVPERGNGVPDVLDEARWELDFLMRMQVPEGKPLAGMAFHKIHDANWTGLPTRPELDDQQRELHRPSTAATLNLAATAAQCARVYAPYDAAFAARCLDSARRAWTAARANPNLIAPDSDGTGGGAYGDATVSDEFYWAGAELYATTGEAAYRDVVTASPWHTSSGAFTSFGFGWADTAALGRIVLATVPTGLPAAETTRLRASVTAAADAHLTTMSGQGYAVPLPATAYVWGSNGQVANNGIVMAVAYGLTGQQRYRAGSIEALDYLLGRNTLGQSYVSGYGEQPSRNQHHRFWANQYDASLPNPPAGSIAGGPNAALQDPVAQEELAGCKPAACYIDDIGSYSTNEVAVNWNAPLAWLTQFAAETTDGGGDGGDPPASGCAVTYGIDSAWNNGFTATVTVKNTSTAPVDGWTLNWTYTGGQRVTNAWNATVSQSGSTVTAKDVGWNKAIAAGGSVSFGFQATFNGSNPQPTAFTLNSAACG